MLFRTTNVIIVSIVNNKLCILDLECRWPGATQDIFMWHYSHLREHFQDNPPNRWLLGDSGYFCEPWLLTPVSEN